jgi:uncharacterized membrane protein
VGLGLLVPAGARGPVTLLGLTTAAVALSLHPAVRALRDAHAAGGYALLVFCTAVGSLADVRQLASGSAAVLATVAATMALAVLLQLAAARLAGIDRDTAIITSTATIFGPPFVAPVAAALGNREILVSGMAMGLLGYAVANYLGLAMAWLLG